MTPDDQTIILHQYATSPFSEKIRKLLAHKRVAWCAVEQPNMMPKPDLLPLTGGYRRIPVLQIGADVYCDSQLIARVLERAASRRPTIYPGASEGDVPRVEPVGGSRALPPDRRGRLRRHRPHGTARVHRGSLEDDARPRLQRRAAPGARRARADPSADRACSTDSSADGRPFLLGADFSLADAACFHPLWFLRVAPSAGPLLDPFTHVRAWMERLEALGQGDMHPLEPADALAIARASSPAPGTVEPGEPNGLAAGDAVTVTPDDYGFDPVAAPSRRIGHEIAIRRTDPALGDVVVHFPRVGFRVARAPDGPPMAPGRPLARPPRGTR